mmetsp:Transcript_19239/g.73619  ORF Transcript_19239/g.73619 Transcript_19239/m.73619 type:complete len:234 (-) Transcript_19239:282-983(-)
MPLASMRASTAPAWWASTLTTRSITGIKSLAEVAMLAALSRAAASAPMPSSLVSRQHGVSKRITALHRSFSVSAAPSSSSAPAGASLLSLAAALRAPTPTTSTAARVSIASARTASSIMTAVSVRTWAVGTAARRVPVASMAPPRQRGGETTASAPRSSTQAACGSGDTSVSSNSALPMAKPPRTMATGVAVLLLGPAQARTVTVTELDAEIATRQGARLAAPSARPDLAGRA